ncbi:MAG: MFS transporter [Crocinitomicaceae bacterium]|nr:MFS transporter [Crocinitomicaceae bacterium]|tara:strand:- start:1347 stop:2840 length:1494 start_codon:yes stop_codon:yes gene_type:complete
MSDTATKKGHPTGLYTLFATEMWERFSYYGMRALLTLYLTAELVNGGFGLERQAALEIYAIFTGLVYLTPILGGWVADKFLGKRKTVYIGGFVMAVGQFLLAASAFMSQTLDPDTRLFLFNFGLGTLIIGNGFFKPNISTIVGDFYDDNDPRKDSAFNIFYMGINLGAILGPFLAGWLGENVDWGWGYFSAGIGLIVSVFWMRAKETTLEQHGLPPNSPQDKFVLDVKDWRQIIMYSIGLVVSTLLIIFLWGFIPPDLASTLITIGFVVLLGGLAFIIFKGTESAEEWSRMSVIVVLAFFNIVFWAGFEQAGGTMNLFAMENTNRMLGSWEIPATWFQNINPIAILIFAPIFSILWLRADSKNLNPRTPIKFALGMFLGAIAFWIMSQAGNLASSGELVSPMWLVVVYVILTLGELMLSPIGLSMITKLAPPKLVSVVMGLWMASFAAGNYFAGIMESVLHKYDLPLYPFISGIMLGTGVIILAITPLLNKAMKGIH